MILNDVSFECQVLMYNSISIIHEFLVKAATSQKVLQFSLDLQRNYRKVASSNTFRLEAHAGFFRLLMKGIKYCQQD